MNAIEEGYSAYPRLSARKAHAVGSNDNLDGAIDGILKEVGIQSEESSLPFLSLVGISIRTEPKPEALDQAMLQWDRRPSWFLDTSMPLVHEQGNAKKSKSANRKRKNTR